MYRRCAVLLLVGCVLLMLRVAPAGAQNAPYTVQPGDTLKISVWKEPELTGVVLVTPDGEFSFPLVGQVDARGKTVSQLQQAVVQRLKKYISDPVVTVALQDIKGNKVYVIGQVKNPGEFVVNPRVDVMQALSMAGGTTPFASLGNIIVIRRTNGVQRTFHFNYNEVLKGRDLGQNIELHSGDVLVVP